MPQALRRGFLLGILLALLGGCTGTPYQPLTNGNSVGFQSGKLPDGRYLIVFIGNPRSSATRVHDFVLLRAAEITKEQGFERFVIDCDCDVSAVKKGYDVTNIDLPSIGSAPRLSLMPDASQVRGMAPNTVETEISTHKVTTPAFALVVKFTNEAYKPAKSGKVQVAEEIIAKLRSKYGLN